MLETETQNTESQTTPEMLSQWDLIWYFLWALTLTISMMGSLPGASGTETFNTWVLAGVMVFTQLLAIWVKGRRIPIRDEEIVYGGLFALQVILWVALVLTSPFWLIHLLGVLVQVHRHLKRRYALGLDLLLFFGAFLQQIEFFGFTLLNLAVWVSVSVGAYLVGLWIYNIVSDREEKQRLLEELEAAQDELVSAERREGILEERSRLSRDIHDTLAQGYIGVIMHLEAADEVQKDDPQKSAFHLKQAEEMAREGLKQARQVVNDLRPDILEDSKGPADALSTLLERWSAQSGIPTELNESGTPGPIHPETELTLLRMTQEGLANVAKHAQATSVQVTLSWIGDQLVLDIEDNGIGFDYESADDDSDELIELDQYQDGGFGLTSMRERVASSGGELHIESIENEGTTLTAILPVRQPLIGEED